MDTWESLYPAKDASVEPPTWDRIAEEQKAYWHVVGYLKGSQDPAVLTELANAMRSAREDFPLPPTMTAWLEVRTIGEVGAFDA